MTFTTGEKLLVLLVFCICLCGAAVLPVELCPDEGGRRLVSDYIFETGILPTGDEIETTLLNSDGSPCYAFSYALRPYLSGLIATLFMRITALFTTSAAALLVASRMVSVLSITAVCFFCLKLGHHLFSRRSSAILLAAFVCFVPQVAFLGMYQNNDALSLAAVTAMLYYLVRGYDDLWPARSCIGLGVSMSIALLSYYSVYGWILMGILFCLVAIAFDARIPDKRNLLLKRAALVLGICLVLAAWFFIRNALLHDGDFFGLATEEASRERWGAMGYTIHDWDRRCDVPGYTPLLFFLEGNCYWLDLTLKSMVGVFGSMNILMPLERYTLYYAVFLLGALLYLVAIIRRRPCRRDALLVLLMLIATGITFALSFWASYTRDYQPQGRYVITALLFIGYLLAYGMDNMRLGFPAEGNPRNKILAILNPATAIMAFWVVLFVLTSLDTVSKMLA